MENIFIHATADVADNVLIGEGTRIWNQAQVREQASLGRECNIGKSVYIDTGVMIGNRVKIQNNASIYHGVTIEDGVMVGPHVCFCNDMHPRAITPEGLVKGQDDWVVGSTSVCYGASIGAGSIILPNVTIGSFALIGAGSVVTHSVPPHALVYGNPARLHGYVCACGQRLTTSLSFPAPIIGKCTVCQQEIVLAVHDLPISQLV